MNNSRRDPEPGTRLGLVHRIGAVAFASGLVVFGVLGLVNQLELFTTSGTPILGLSSNGLLSVISLVTAALLVAAAVRGGRTASTVTFGIGVAFLLSGVGGVLVLDTPFNVLAFRMSNVIFSLLAGGLLMVLGAYGRFTGRLPDDNPYRQAGESGAADGVDSDAAPLPTIYPHADDAVAVRDLADAERAVAQHSATAEQAAAVHAIRDVRSAEDRLVAWRSATGPATEPSAG
ncbi:DUF4383 domain-containing protein [Pseudonocardia abyssalis]|uniref:DUF4383 domain-containing protein n=1 Tax=Pseudonocardia abyssalis TaxID=2792008 RepID=UPI001CF61C47|nr:DUF4383 domain-containing protein [Pseudonocardia abyssalis]